MLARIASVRVGAVLAASAFCDLGSVDACLPKLLAAVLLFAVARPADMVECAADRRARRLSIALGVALAVMRVCICLAIAPVPLVLCADARGGGYAAAMYVGLSELLRIALVATGVCSRRGPPPARRRRPAS